MPRRRVVIAILGLASIVLMAWLLSEGDGRDIPNAMPVESNRIVHPAGFSIVNPENWKSKLVASSDPFLPPGIFISPRSTRVSRRHGASLQVTQPPKDRIDIDGFSETEFQGQIAYKRLVTRSGSFMDDPPAMSYTLCFQRDGDWFEIRYSIYSAHDDLPDMIASYIDTFRYSKKAEP